jgi:hypothetical protein
VVAPNPAHVFFEQTVFKAQIGHQFLQRQSLGAQILHLACIRLAGRITGQPLLAGLEKFLRPAVIQALGDPFLAAKLGNRRVATRTGGATTLNLVLSRICAAPSARLCHSAFEGQGAFSSQC